jgi:hypothetical protein
MSSADQKTAGDIADTLIELEVSIQDKMWGDSNERADATGNQMTHAAIAQLVLAAAKHSGVSSETATEVGSSFYPTDWDGFRDYGSNIANLVVAAAFIRSEIKRRVLLREDTTRTKRGEPYTRATPYMSSEEALTARRSSV